MLCCLFIPNKNIKVLLEQPAIYRDTDEENAKCCFEKSEDGNKIVGSVDILNCTDTNYTFDKIYKIIIEKYEEIFPQKKFNNRALLVPPFFSSR